MIAVIFEVWPSDGHKDDYLEIAASIRADLNNIDGLATLSIGGDARLGCDRQSIMSQSRPS